MIKTLHLHIGTHKTGTTSLQRFLYGNRSALADSGFVYPTNSLYFWAGECSHSFLAHALRTERPHYLPEAVHYDRQTAYEALQQDCLRNRGKDMIISSEHFSLLYKNDDTKEIATQFQRLADTVKVYVYIRRQDYAIEANYKQGLRSRAFHCDFETYVSNVLETEFGRYDYASLLSIYRAQFGDENVVARVYAPDKLVNRSVVDDFLSLIGIQNSPSFQQVPKTNSSLPAEMLEFLRHFAPHVNRQQWQALKRRVLAHQHIFRSAGLSFLTHEVSQRLLDAYGTSNRSLALMLNDSVDIPVFEEPVAKGSAVPPSMSANELAHLTCEIFDFLK